MKRLILFAVVALALVAAYLYTHKEGVPITISEGQINAALQKSFPVSQTYMQVIDLAYSNPRVTLKPESDRVQLELDAKVGFKLLPGLKNLSGTTIIDSGIRYEAGTRQFFLADPTVRKLEIAGLPREQIDKVTQIAVELTRSQLEKKPVYTIEGPQAAMLATNVLVKDVRVKSGGLQVVLGL